MITDSTHAIASELAEARATGNAVEPLTERWPELTVADAYAVQRLGVESRISDGERVIGHKVGLTSSAMQQQLGVTEPDFGSLFDVDAYDDGATIDPAALIAPRVEPEIAFVLASPLDSGDVGVDDVLAATDYVVPALEIIDSRISDWRIALADTVADNASGAGVVLGRKRTPVSDVDLRTTQVILSVDGAKVSVGRGEAVLGHPAKAVAWLANTLAALGVTLDAGHIVLPGSMTKAVDLGEGQSVVADFGPLGSVSCRGGR